jgi:hypothetical protein
VTKEAIWHGMASDQTPNWLVVASPISSAWNRTPSSATTTPASRSINRSVRSGGSGSIRHTSRTRTSALSSSAYPSIALPATNKKSEFIARCLPVTYTISKLAHRSEHRSSAVDWAYFHGKAAVQVIVGHESDKRSIQTAKLVLRAVLAGEGIGRPIQLVAWTR